MEQLLTSPWLHHVLTLILFGVYFTAPYLTGGPPAGNGDGCCDHDSPSADVTGVVLHVLAFTSGMVAALIGVSLS